MLEDDDASVPGEGESVEASMEAIIADLNSKAYDRASTDLDARSTWEGRQRLWYRMRHQGLGRKNKPYPHAADLHVPLADSAIDKLKPYYYQQVFSADRLAKFYHQSADGKQYADMNAEFFDYQLKQRANFEEEVMYLCDSIPQTGAGVLKYWWDAEAKSLQFENIDPAFVIVPSGSKSVRTAPRVTHVIQLCEEDYRRNANYRQDEDLIEKLLGSDQDDSNQSKTDEKKRREGITDSKEPDTIIIWESWQRKRDAEGAILDEWIVLTYSPRCPGKVIRAPYQPNLGHDRHPFVDFPMEIKDKGAYASRGVPERVAPYEAYACKTWNARADSLDFISKPLFERTGNDVLNTANVSMKPGSVLPQGLKIAESGTVPPNLLEEINFIKSTAEELLMSPNFGVSDGEGSDPRTATEIQYVGQVSSQGQDLRARVFRKSLADLYGLCWKTLVLHAKGSLGEFYSDNTKYDEKALSDAFRIEPDGNPDMWNKQANIQRAFARFTTLKGDPFIDQLELRRDLIGSEDPKDVERLVIDPNAKASDEQEEQAMEIVIMLAGFPAQVSDDDDDMAHCQSILGWMVQAAVRGEPIKPETLQLVVQHFMQHVEALKAKKQAPLAKQAEQALQQTMREASALAQQGRAMAPQGGLS